MALMKKFMLLDFGQKLFLEEITKKIWTEEIKLYNKFKVNPYIALFACF